MPVPLLILSDAPTSGSGLGRIARDLSIRIHQHLPEVFRVGTAGYGGPFSRSLGFPQYQIDMSDWVVHNLPEIWEDFAGDEKGILMTIWDASRLLWLAHPQHCSDQRLRKWLNDSRPELWGYFPVDATGPNDKLTFILGHIMKGFDRVHTYSEWAQRIIQRTCPTLDVTQLPHGIDTTVFFPRPKVQARHSFGQRLGMKQVKGKKAGQPIMIPDDALLIGAVATNQTRKDWGLAMETAAALAKEQRVMLWCHIDVLEKHWSLPNLITDYGMEDNIMVSANVEFTDEAMAWAYSACDLTLGIGIAEGFGYPIFESLACGTPCIHGNDGGAPEHMPSWMLVEPLATRLEGAYNTRRNVYSHFDWAYAALQVKTQTGWDFPRHLDWNELWPRWEKWFREGLK